VINWRFRASIENRQTKILITEKEKYLAWLKVLPLSTYASLTAVRKQLQTL
jgi:hypothetical protein